jgi:hypothetical protein
MATFLEQFNAIGGPDYGSNLQPSPSAASPMDFGGLLFGGMDGGLNEYLTDAQRQAMQRQAMLSAAAALLKSSGRSTTPVSIGQALGQGLEAGAAGYQQAQQGAIAQLMTKQKLDEYKRQVSDEQAYRDMFAQVPVAGAAMTPMQAAALPVADVGMGPSPQRAAMIGRQMPAGVAPSGGMPVLSQVQMNLLSRMTPKEGRAKLLELAQAPEVTGQAFKAEDGNYYYPTKQGPIPASIIPADVRTEEYGAPVAEVRGGQTVMVQYNRKGDSRIAQGSMPYEPQSQDIRAFEYITGRPLAGTGETGVKAVGQYRQQVAPKNIVNVPDMTGGQKGFENEMKLSGAFKGEPIYKELQGMKSAFSQVNTALDQGSPIGDLAGATKMMKLMDEGSVVRESELALAMAAAGRMDRLKNYISQSITGEKLTPTQREDFKRLSTELYAAAADAYNKKRGEYEEFGQSYNFKNLGTALGPKVDVPSIVKLPKSSAASAATGTPQNIQDILNKYPPRKP